MKAAVFYKAGDVRIEERDIPNIDESDVLIKVRAASICGTDIHIYNGDFDVLAPLIIGHDFSGEVEAVGSAVKDFRRGDRVLAEPVRYCGECPYCRMGRYNICPRRKIMGIHIDGAFAEYVSAPSRNVFRVPENVSFEEAAIMEPAAVALHTMDFAKPSIGEWVAIIGQGPMGLLQTQVARLCGLKVIAIDLISQRLELARKYGASYIVNAAKSDPVSKVIDLTGEGADIVIESSGSVGGVKLTTHLAKVAGRIIIVGSSRELLQHGPASEEILTKELSVYGVAGAAPGKYQIALELASQGKIDVKSMITHRFPLQETKKALETAKMKSSDLVKALIIP